LAAFSIRTPWQRNIDNALYWLSGDLERVRCMQLHLTKADAVRKLTGASAESMACVRAVLKGDKIAAFADNIRYPDRSAFVTLDSHMARAVELASYSDLRL